MKLKSILLKLLTLGATLMASGGTSPEIIVPLTIYNRPEVHIKDLLELHRRYGFCNFALVSPSMGWRSVGYPPQSAFVEGAEKFKTIREELAKHNIRCGWWVAFSVKSGTSPDWSPIIRHDGTAAPFANCPLDPIFSKRFSEDVALFTKIAQPDYIILEDDFSIAAAGKNGCFCSRHLAEFAKRVGKTYSREELVELLRQDGEEALREKKAWAELERDSLVLFATSLRTAVDQVAPQVSIGAMQSGKWDSEGDATEAVCRALAGTRHTPFCRIHGAFYAGESIIDIPSKLFSALYAKQHISPLFRFFYECDTYPHNAFFTSGSCMKVMMTAAISMGYDGAIFQAIQPELDNPGEETAYGEMYASQIKRFRTLSAAAARCELKGVRLPYNPYLSTNFAETEPEWLKCVAEFGIPFTTAESPITFLSGAQGKLFTDSELTSLLRRGVFLDAASAKEVQARGFGAQIGVEVGAPAITGMSAFDLSGREIITDSVFPEIKGRRMRRANVYSPGGNGVAFRLTPKDSKCQTLTKLVDFRGEELTAGMTWFENSLGGKVAVLGMTVTNNQSVSLFNYRRMRIIQELIIRAADEFVMVRNAPRVHVIMNEARDGENSEFFGMLTLSNLCPDRVKSVSLHLPPKWKRFRKIQRLNDNGEWSDCLWRSTVDGVELLFPLEYVTPEVVRFIR